MYQLTHLEAHRRYWPQASQDSGAQAALESLLSTLGFNRLGFVSVLIVSASLGTWLLGSNPTTNDTGGKMELPPPPPCGQGRGGGYNQLLQQNHTGQERNFPKEEGCTALGRLEE